MRGKYLLAAVSLLLIVTMGACGGANEEPTVEEQSAARWDEIETVKAAVDAKTEEIKNARQRLIDARAAANADETQDDPSEEATDGEAEALATPEEIEAEIAAADQELAGLLEKLNSKVAEFINESGLVEGAEYTPEQKRAFDMKAEIDVRYAQEYIDRGGDYQRAIDIYTTALRSDPENEILLNAKAEAERLRYMDEERFSLVKKKMTQDEVRSILGTPRASNVREFPNENRVGWFYPKEVKGAAAGVYFKEKARDSGVWVVELASFDAIEAPTDEASTEEEEG